MSTLYHRFIPAHCMMLIMIGISVLYSSLCLSTSDFIDSTAVSYFSSRLHTAYQDYPHTLRHKTTIEMTRALSTMTQLATLPTPILPDTWQQDICISSSIDENTKIRMKCFNYTHEREERIRTIHQNLEHNNPSHCETMLLLEELIDIAHDETQTSVVSTAVSSFIGRVESSRDFDICHTTSSCVSPLVTASKIVRIASHMHEPLTAKLINSIASLVWANTNARAIPEIDAIISLTFTLKSNPIHVPLFVRIVNSVPLEFGTTDSATLKLRVANILGDIYPDTNVSISSISGPFNSPELLSESVQLSESVDTPGVFTWLVPSNALSGTYKAKLRTSCAGISKQKITSVLFSVRQTTPTFESIALCVSKLSSLSDVSDDDKHTLSTPSSSTIISTPLRVAIRRSFIHLEVSIASQRPLTHIVARFTNIETHDFTVFMIEHLNGNNYALSLHIGSSVFLSSIPSNGRYSIELVASDPLFSSNSTWLIANNVNINLKNLMVSKATVTHHKLAEIEHVFSSTVSPPSSIVPFIFSIAIISCFIGLLLAWRVLGVDIALPSISALPLAVIFQGCVAALLLLFATYWYCLTLFNVMRPLIMLSTIALLTGHRVLVSHIKARHQFLQANEKQKAQ